MTPIKVSVVVLVCVPGECYLLFHAVPPGSDELDWYATLHVVCRQGSSWVVLNVAKVRDVLVLSTGIGGAFTAHVLKQLHVLAEALT
jgi:hypothetical protein